MKADKKICPVTLEPELEEIAGMWTGVKRLETARKWKRWVRQLEVSAVIMIRRNAQHHTCRPRTLKYVGIRKAALN